MKASLWFSAILQPGDPSARPRSRTLNTVSGKSTNLKVFRYGESPLEKTKRRLNASLSSTESASQSYSMKTDKCINNINSQWPFHLQPIHKIGSSTSTGKSSMSITVLRWTRCRPSSRTNWKTDWLIGTQSKIWQGHLVSDCFHAIMKGNKG